MFKKIVSSFVVVAAVATLATGATLAYFTDQVQDTGNTIATGTLSLAVDGTHNSASDIFHVTNLVPGGWDTAQGAGGANIKNTGTVPGDAWFTFTNIQTTGDGSLANLVQPVCQLNDPPYGHTYTPANYSLEQLNNYKVDIGTLQPGHSVDIYCYNLWPNGSPSVDNAAEGESITYTVVFRLDQVI